MSVYKKLSAMPSLIVIVFLWLSSTASAQSYNVRNSTDEFLIILMLLAIIIIYPIPSFIAFKRGHPNRWVILLINAIFGGTGLGWFGSLIWAMSAIHKSPTGSNGGESGLNLFINDPQPVHMVDKNDGVQASQDQIPDTNADIMSDDTANQLHRIKALFDNEAITEAEHTQLKNRILEQYLR